MKSLGIYLCLEGRPARAGRVCCTELAAIAAGRICEPMSIVRGRGRKGKKRTDDKNKDRY